MPLDGLTTYVNQCPKCKRVMLIEVSQFGVSHIGDIGVVCADCLNRNDKYLQEHPEILEEIDFMQKEGMTLEEAHHKAMVNKAENDPDYIKYKLNGSIGYADKEFWEANHQEGYAFQYAKRLPKKSDEKVD